MNGSAADEPPVWSNSLASPVLETFRVFIRRIEYVPDTLFSPWKAVDAPAIEPAMLCENRASRLVPSPTSISSVPLSQRRLPESIRVFASEAYGMRVAVSAPSR